MVVPLEPLAAFHTPRGFDLTDEPAVNQQADRVPRRVFRAAAVESDGLHAGPAYILLPRAADQVTVQPGQIVSRTLFMQKNPLKCY